MAKADAVEAALAELRELAKGDKSEASLKALRDVLKHKSNLVVARAADIAGKWNATELSDAVAAAFDRFMHNPVKTDSGCGAKTAIIHALYTMGEDRGEIFAAAVKHRQLEASWGPPVDTAAELRGVAALALVRMRHREAMELIVPLLVDPYPQARVAAIRAIAYDGRDEGAWLLRLKALFGDGEIDVTAECFAALLRLSPAKSIAFLADFLHCDNLELRDAAAMALAHSRQHAALELLIAEWNREIDGTRKRALMLTIGQMRDEAAIAFLLEQVLDGRTAAARDAIEALASYASDEGVRARIAAAVEQRDGAAIRDAFATVFA
jgi:HEAT repeat protein